MVKNNISLNPKKKENKFISYLKHIFGKNYKDIVFNVVIYVIFVILLFACVFPFIHVFVKSVTVYTLVGDKSVAQFGLDAYTLVFESNVNLFKSFVFSIVVTVVSTIMSLIITTLGSYPLIRKDLKGRKVILLYIIFAMIFSGGLIPFFLLMKDLNLIGNPMIYFVIGLVSPYNIIIMKNFFSSLPSEIFESARVDGAGEVRTLFSIALPLSGPIVATIALWTAVGKWNDWMTTLYYMTDQPRSLWMFQYYLQAILNESSSTSSTVNPEIAMQSDNIQNAAIFISILPIIIFYPFVQKYFVKGVLLGSVKG